MAVPAPAVVRRLGTRGIGQDKIFRTQGNTPKFVVQSGTVPQKGVYPVQPMSVI